MTFATAIVNDCVTAVVPSVADKVTALSPTSVLSGVPDNTPLLIDSQFGHVVHETVTTWLSGSLVSTVYEYALSSEALVTAELVIDGASLSADTVIVTESVSEPPLPSDTVTVNTSV